MRAGFIGWLAIIVNAIAFVPAGAHLFALPNKMRLAETDYSVAQSIYGGWALFGYVFLAALVINIIFVILLRGQTLPFVLCAAAALRVASSLAVFFTRTYPANQPTSNWTIIPANWQELRQQWEMSHAANVAPRAGAWIETAKDKSYTRSRPVAPRAGAWIETIFRHRSSLENKSPLAQGRGLKLENGTTVFERLRVAPRAGAWIETYNDSCLMWQLKLSPLAQGRGLKHDGYLQLTW